MSKLTAPQRAAHAQACAYLGQDILSLDQREFVINNWQESATHINSAAGAFFTPLELAFNFSIECGAESCSGSVIDLCAGIGALSFAVHCHSREKRRVVCVEKNPDYVAVGRKVLPEAEWICADVFDLPPGLGQFQFAISNPPFGKGGPIKGVSLDLNVVAVASTLAEYGVFILPVNSVPFAYSGRRHFEKTNPSQYAAFHKKTGLWLEPNCGIDCSVFIDQWRGVSPSVEIALADFSEQLYRIALDQLEEVI